MRQTGSRSRRCASFDFAQDEVEFDVPSTLYLILNPERSRHSRRRLAAAPHGEGTLCANAVLHDACIDEVTMTADAPAGSGGGHIPTPTEPALSGNGCSIRPVSHSSCEHARGLETRMMYDPEEHKVAPRQIVAGWLICIALVPGVFGIGPAAAKMRHGIHVVEA